MSHISTTKRLSIYARDDWACKDCGFTQTEAEVVAQIETSRVTNLAPPGEHLTVDHVVPLAKGGTSRYENLVTRCWSCNQRKGCTCTVPVAQAAAARKPADRFERAGRLMRRAAGSTDVNPMSEHAHKLAAYAQTL